MANVVRIGVVGLGRRWREEYGPALLALRDRFEVRAVCDPAAQTAHQEARRLGCAAAAGPAELLEDDGVEALLLADRPWYRLWPLELACRARRPVFCCPSVEEDEPHADSVRAALRESGVPVMFEEALVGTPAAARLRELLDGVLGRPRYLFCQVAAPPPSAGSGLLAGAGVALLRWCADVLGGEPRHVTAVAEEGPFASVLLEFGGGRVAHVARWSAPGGESVRLQVVAERGTAVVEPPARVRWADATGKHSQKLPPPRPLARGLLEQFHRALSDGEAPRPGPEEVYRALEWLRAAERSRAEGRRVEVPS